jgi:hypothetical protein
VGEEGVPLRDIATIVGQHLNLPIVAKSSHEAAEHFGWLAYFVGANLLASSAQTRELLGWRPTHPLFARQTWRQRSGISSSRSFNARNDLNPRSNVVIS